MTISMMSFPKRMEVMEQGGVTKLQTPTGEIVTIATGRGTQYPEYVNVVVVWEAKGYKVMRTSENMFLIPGENLSQK